MALHSTDGGSFLRVFDLLIVKEAGSQLKFAPSRFPIAAMERPSINHEQAGDDNHDGRKPIPHSHDTGSDRQNVNQETVVQGSAAMVLDGSKSPRDLA
jgi:hypothetical protein